MEAEPRKVAGPALALVRDGALLARDGHGRALRLEAGDLLALRPGGECTLAASGPRARARVLELGSEFAARAAALAGCALDGLGEPLWIGRRGSDPARRAVRLLRELDGTTAATPRSALEGLALRIELLGLALEERPFAVAPGEVRRPERSLCAAVDALFAGPLEHATLGALAERAGLSERQVSRLFRAQYGKTFRERLCEQRLEHAKALLADTRRSVLHVAGETGWSSLAHFNAVFRRRVGLTPTQYRQWARQGIGSSVPVTGRTSRSSQYATPEPSR